MLPSKLRKHSARQKNSPRFVPLNIKPVKVHLNKVIYKEGDPVNGFYLVGEGSVRYGKYMSVEKSK